MSFERIIAFFPSIFGFISLYHPVIWGKSVNLEQVVQRGHQLPLAVDFLFAAQSETFDADGAGEVAEDRFDNAEAYAVDGEG